MIGAIFYVRVNSQDMFNPSVEMDVCHIFNAPDEAFHAKDIKEMLLMDMEEDAAEEEIHSQFPCIRETSQAIHMMGMRARFNPEMRGPYLVRFPEDMPEDMVSRDLVERIVFGRDKKDLQAFLESAKL